MSIFRNHILIPIDEDTVQSGVFELKKQLENQLQAGTSTRKSRFWKRERWESSPGVVLVILPERVYYTRVKVSDIPPSSRSI